MEAIPVTTIGLIGIIFSGFFGLIKYVTTNQQKSTDAFLKYIETKNGNLERVAKEFSVSTEKSHETMKAVAVELAKLTSKIEDRE